MIKIKDINHSFTNIDVDGDIEFAKVIIDTFSVFEEGFSFSPLYRNKMWDGKKHFYEILDKKTIQIAKGFVTYVIKDLKHRKKEYIYEKIDGSSSEITPEEFNDFIKSLNTPFMPYDYQEKAALDSINEKRLVLSAATSCLDKNTKIKAKISKEDYELIIKFREERIK